MASFLEDLASKAGLGGDQAHQGVGALLTMLRDRLDPTTFSHLQDSIPNAKDALSQFTSKLQADQGGLIDAVKGMAAKFLGGNGQEATEGLPSHFGNAGFSADQLKSFLPALHEMLANKLPPHVASQIREHLPDFDQVKSAT